MIARIAPVLAGFLVATASFGADLKSDLQYMGQTYPASASNTNAPFVGEQTVALEGLPDKTIRDALARPRADQGALATRGAKEIGIYRAAAPSVVLIATEKALGSGSYLGDGLILTNWHVVQGASAVGVLFKPTQEGDPIDEKNLVRGDVLRTDQAHDLALVRLAVTPKGLRPLELGDRADIEIGADVHAIGHPIGETWSYTKGLISQFRPDYVWKNKDETIEHHADVIQTQTPISPGNSGGPLLSDAGKILGVNSFSSTEGESLNFAVAVEDVAAFLRAGPTADPSGQVAARPTPAPKCRPTMLFNGRNRDNTGRLTQVDSNCDRIADMFLIVPDDEKKPIQALFDTNFDGKIDIIVEDVDRDGRWDISYHDVDFDGTIDLVGFHPDGKLTPSSYQKFTGFLTAQ